MLVAHQPSSQRPLRISASERRAGGHVGPTGSAPPRCCGASIRGEYANRGGNKRLKSSLFNSAFAALHHRPSRAYYDKKRAEGKTHKRLFTIQGVVVV